MLILIQCKKEWELDGEFPMHFHPWSVSKQQWGWLQFSGSFQSSQIKITVEGGTITIIFVDKKNSENINNLFKVISKWQSWDLCLSVLPSHTAPPSVLLFSSTSCLSAGAFCSPESHTVLMGTGMLVTARCSPATLQTFILGLVFWATCASPQLTCFLLRHFSSSKPSSWREIKPLLFPQSHAGMLHLLEASHTVRENEIKVTELFWDTAVLGIQRVGAGLMEVGVAACS